MMKAMILAAGLGTRLKPWTLSHPKALVPVAGKPMLYWVIEKMKISGFNEIIINVHHFSEQIMDWLKNESEKSLKGIKVYVSDESDELLNTGGGLVKAWHDGLIGQNERVLIHNVDILSNVNLGSFVSSLKVDEDVSVNDAGGVCTDKGLLLVSNRESSRKLIFDSRMELKGWRNLVSGDIRPAGLEIDDADRNLAFSGIYAVSGSVIAEMYRLFGLTPFPVMDYFLNEDRKTDIKGYEIRDLHLIDIGKPHTLELADKSFEDFVCY